MSGKTFKRCSRCGDTKDTILFGKNKSSKDGYQHWCKPCRKICSHESNGSNGSPTTFRVMSATEYGWVAGIIEGEGTIYARTHHKKNIIAGITVVTTDKDTVERLYEYTGVGCIGVHREAKGNNKKLYRWSSTRGAITIDLLIGLLPMLGKRRQEKAKEVLGMATYG